MYSEADIESAIGAGALTPDAAQRFRDHVAAGRASPAVDEEQFRLLTGFNDIFVSIAAVILLVAVAWIGHAIPPHIGGDGPTAASGLLVAATSWGLAEFFTRKRRMALPSIILLLAFVGGVLVAATLGSAMLAGEDTLDDNNVVGGLILAVSSATAAGAAWLHWRRFRVPITVAAGAAAVAGVLLAVVAGLLAGMPASREVILGLTLVLGVGVFLFAMVWDSSDPQRQTRRSDVAFWLHLLAAPMIVHPVFSLLGLNDGEANAGEALIVLLVYVLLGLTALAIDRRALLVSALAYVLWALSDLFERFGLVELNVALTAFVIGSVLLLLSAFWTNARRAVVQPLPPGLRSKLPIVDRLAVSSQPA